MECTPAMAARLVAVRQKLLIGMRAHLTFLDEDVSPGSIDSFMGAMSQIQNMDAVNLHLGGVKADTKLRSHTR